MLFSIGIEFVGLLKIIFNCIVIHFLIVDSVNRSTRGPSKYVRINRSHLHVFV